jgi:hypothetical protein
MAHTPILNLLTTADAAGAESLAAGPRVRDEPRHPALLALHQAGIGATDLQAHLPCTGGPMSAAVAVAAPRVTRRRTPAPSVVPGMADAALIALCTRLQACFVVARALRTHPAATEDDRLAIQDMQDDLLEAVAETPARTRAGRHAKATLAVDVLRPANMDWLHGKLVMDLLEGLAHDVLAEAVP